MQTIDITSIYLSCLVMARIQILHRIADAVITREYCAGYSETFNALVSLCR